MTSEAETPEAGTSEEPLTELEKESLTEGLSFVLKSSLPQPVYVLAVMARFMCGTEPKGYVLEPTRNGGGCKYLAKFTSESSDDEKGEALMTMFQLDLQGGKASIVASRDFLFVFDKYLQYTAPKRENADEYNMPTYEAFCSDERLREALVGKWLGRHWQACIQFIGSHCSVGVFFDSELVARSVGKREFPSDAKRTDKVQRFPLRIEIAFEPLPALDVSQAIEETHMRTSEAVDSIEKYGLSCVEESMLDVTVALLDFCNGCDVENPLDIVAACTVESGQERAMVRITQEVPMVIPLLRNGQQVGTFVATSRRVSLEVDIEPLVPVTSEIKGTFLVHDDVPVSVFGPLFMAYLAKWFQMLKDRSNMLCFSLGRTKLYRKAPNKDYEFGLAGKRMLEIVCEFSKSDDVVITIGTVAAFINKLRADGNLRDLRPDVEAATALAVARFKEEAKNKRREDDASAS